MNHFVTTVILLAGLLFAVPILVSSSQRMHLPGNHQGYEPEQPIAFSHRLHAGELQIDCHYCHSAAERGRHAGIPAAETCMNCHRFVTSTFGELRAEDERAQEEGREIRQVVNPEIRKIYEALALDVENDFAPLPGRQPEPIPWVKVHNLPSFVYFDHRAHVIAGVDCSECHGPIETMERVRQVEDRSRGWCVNCHRDVNQRGVNGQEVHASIDCDACHH